MDESCLAEIGGFLIDLNGVVFQDDEAIEGAAEAITRIKAAGKGCLFCTNTTTSSRITLHRKLVDLGMSVTFEEIFGVTTAAVDILKKEGAKRVWLVMNRDTRADFLTFEQDADDPEWIVVGEIGEDWSYGLLNRMFHRVLDGARVLALQEMYPGRTREQLLLDLLTSALDELEAALPYIPGDKIVSEDDYGDPIYEDVGPTPRFLQLTRKYREQLQQQPAGQVIGEPQPAN